MNDSILYLQVLKKTSLFFIVLITRMQFFPLLFFKKHLITAVCSFLSIDDIFDSKVYVSPIKTGRINTISF